MFFWVFLKTYWGFLSSPPKIPSPIVRKRSHFLWIFLEPFTRIWVSTLQRELNTNKTIKQHRNPFSFLSVLLSLNPEFQEILCFAQGHKSWSGDLVVKLICSPLGDCHRGSNQGVLLGLVPLSTDGICPSTQIKVYLSHTNGNNPMANTLYYYHKKKTYRIKHTLTRFIQSHKNGQSPIKWMWAYSHYTQIQLLKAHTDWIKEWGVYFSTILNIITLHGHKRLPGSLVYIKVWANTKNVDSLEIKINAISLVIITVLSLT